MNIKYPQVNVRMVGEDGNAFAILGRVQYAMRHARLTNEQIKEFLDEATAGDYDHLLATVMSYCTVDGGLDDDDMDDDDMGDDDMDDE